MTRISRYHQARREFTTPQQLLLMLYQEAIKQMNYAIRRLDEGKMAQAVPHLHKAREVFLELSNSLDASVAPEMASQLHTLYRWCVDELVAAGRYHSREPVVAVLRVTTVLFEGWQEAVRRARTEAA